MKAVYPTTYVPLSPAEIELFLGELVDVIADALQATPFSPEPITEVGDRLVAAHFTGPETLQRTVEVLGRALLFSPELRDVDRLAEKVVAILGSLSASFAIAMRLDAFDQQEEIKQALFSANTRMERVLELSEARFREVFSSSATGIAITDLDGHFVEVNQALVDILGGEEEAIAGLSLDDVFHPDDVAALRVSYRDIRDGVIDRLREQRRLVRVDGEPSWAHLAVSLLRDADGAPAYYVTMVEDISELHLLQKNLDFQLLHDSLTGLPNRQHFVTQLEKMHGRSEHGITLLHLDLDAFSMINNGLGHAVGDRLLKVIAQRLQSAVANENAVVARIGVDEFAIVVDNSPTTPKATELIDLINEELAAPEFIAERGISLSATIGVVDRPAASWTVAELLRAADTTLHQAKKKGKRQWLPYDPQEYSRRKTWFAVAASMPGALENGELELDFQPVVGLADRTVIGVAAQLRWGDWGHQQCLELAEETGLSLPIGQWMLRAACEQVVDWRDALGERTPPLHVALSPMQSRDEDLVGTVKRTLDDTGLPFGELRIGLNTRAAVDSRGDDNAQVLSDSGIATGLDEFHGGQEELALLTELPISSLTVAPSVVRRLAALAQDSLLHQAMSSMVAVVHRAGAIVIASGVRTEAEASWWASIGTDAAQGEFFAPPQPAWEIEELLSSS
jgi:diguanylate cyclase (GGDEF)-like protein/PAS domain S-box-containing protein